jgi:ABC-2 type transport system ATP-binding protein
MSAAPAVRCDALGKRYGSRWALRDCTLEIPAGSVTALVGPNGAGKTTLLQLAVGLTKPSAGEVSVLGHSPRRDAAAVLPRLGFVAQEHPLYKGFSVAEMLELGRKLNPSWDAAFARARVEALGLPLDQRAGKLSGGQQAQIALTLALAKRPDLLLLDEPVASLDPLARREFMQSVMEAVAESGMTVILSSHIVADLERVCDYLVLLCDGRVQLAGDVDALVAEHRLLSGPRVAPESLVRGDTVIEERHTERQSTILVRGSAPVVDPRYDVTTLGLEDLVLAYLRRRRTAASRSFRALEISA